MDLADAILTIGDKVLQESTGADGADLVGVLERYRDQQKGRPRAHHDPFCPIIRSADQAPDRRTRIQR